MDESINLNFVDVWNVGLILRGNFGNGFTGVRKVLRGTKFGTIVQYVLKMVFELGWNSENLI